MNQPGPVPTAARAILGLTLLVLIGLELLWLLQRPSRAGREVAYDWKESLANLGILVGVQVSKALFLGWQLLVLGWFAHIRVATWGTGALAFAGTFILVDFLYYWQHRLMHQSKPFWAFHLVHHSAQTLNLTTSFRLNWVTPLIGSFFYVPAVLLGAPAEYVLASVGLNLLYQFWLHTEAIGRLGPIEGIINTPSAHRVHHASNPEYLDRNYGGVLMVWDRLFGTYAEERAAVRYGITTGPEGYNPFVLVFHGFVDLFRGRLTSRG